MTIKVAIFGFGRMGQAAARAIHNADDMEIVAAYDIHNNGNDIGILAGFGKNDISVCDPKEIGDVKFDVGIDFSTPDACLENAQSVADMGAAYIVGTTGISKDQIEKLTSIMNGLGLLISPNMSVGVNVFWKLIGEAAKNLKGYDVEVIEAHHKFKKDSPSGTAMKAVEIICDETGADIEKDIVYGREGLSPRKDGEIGVHSIRAGDIVGEHTAIFSIEGERFEIGHKGHTRDSFATGIPQAVKFINKKKAVFDMNDVLGL